MPWVAKFWYRVKPEVTLCIEAELDPKIPVFLNRFDPEKLVCTGYTYERSLMVGEPEITWQEKSVGASSQG